jgi:hypothetical protein
MHANKSIGSMTERQRIAVAALLKANACACPWNDGARADLASDSEAAPNVPACAGARARRAACPRAGARPTAVARPNLRDSRAALTMTSGHPSGRGRSASPHRDPLETERRADGCGS